MRIKKILKTVYDSLPFKHTVFSVVKMFWSPPESVYNYLTFRGILKVKTPCNTTFKMRHYGDKIENDIFWNSLKNWEIISMEIWCELCRDAHVVIDAGANTGIYSLIAKSVNAKASVFAFEPVERVYEKLVFNNTLNNFDISCNKVALSNYEGEATLYDLPDQHVYTAYVNKNHFEENVSPSAFKIKATTLDDFIVSKNLSRIDVIKIDVELHEVEVLQGFSKHIKEFRPTILIEILNDEIGNKVEELIEELGYEYYNTDEKKGIRKTEHIRKSDHYNYLLCSKEILEKYELEKSFIR